ILRFELAAGKELLVEANAGSVVEAANGGISTNATGTLTACASTFVEVASAAASDQGYGTYTVNAAGLWSYTLDNGNAAVQALNVGDQLIDTISVAAVDGDARIVAITIAGINDAPVSTNNSVTTNEDTAQIL